MMKPLDRYRQLLNERTATREHWSKIEFRVALARLAVMASVFVVAWLAVQQRSFSLAWVIVPVVAFGVLMTLHDRVLSKRRRADQASQYYQAGIDRIEERWRESEAENGARFLEPGHLYAEDLDVLGPASLYLLLNRTRTRTGEETLANWLLEPATVDEVRARQEAISELVGLGGLREDMATLGGEIRSDLDPDRLVAWAASDQVLAGVQWVRWLMAATSVANVATLALWLAGILGGRPLLFSILCSFALFLLVRTRVGVVVNAVEQTGRDLEVVSELMDRLEGESFQAPWLSDRAEQMRLGGQSPGKKIRALQKWVQRLESRRNPFFAPFGALVLWSSQIAFVVESWRSKWGDRVARWLAITGELEAASSLATFAYERGLAADADEESAGVNFPQVTGRTDSPGLEAVGLGHPLIDPQVCVRNDIALAVDCSLPGHGSDAPQALVISGSNMSGKSTFLRSCGLNVVLAWAGAPVVAQSMTCTPLAVGASIRIQDSLEEGSSKFYAEIKRLRSILDLAKADVPALCLLDEILHGTNSHDRRIGAAAVVKALLEEDALVMVTTHDLVLARLTDAEDFESGRTTLASEGEQPVGVEGNRRLRNVHFVDTIENGRIHFDYTLRPGVVEKSNALALMREVGLDV